MEHEINKLHLAITRAVLFAVGALIGGLGVWQYFETMNTSVAEQYQILIICVSSLVLAFALLFSGRPIYYVCSAIKAVIVEFFSTHDVGGVVAAVCGTLIGIALVVPIEFALQLCLPVLAIRMLVDIVAGLLLVAVFSYGALFIYKNVKNGEKKAVSEEAKRSYVGYILAPSAFFTDKVFYAPEVLLNVKVSSETANELIARVDEEGGVDALRRYKALLPRLGVIEDKKSDVFGLAEKHRLKVVTRSGENGSVSLSVFEPYRVSEADYALTENKESDTPAVEPPKESETEADLHAAAETNGEEDKTKVLDVDEVAGAVNVEVFSKNRTGRINKRK